MQLGFLPTGNIKVNNHPTETTLALVFGAEEQQCAYRKVDGKRPAGGCINPKSTNGKQMREMRSRWIEG